MKAEQLDVRVAPSPLVFARVGIIVPKYKRSIVERNRLRRRLRELVRLKLLPVLREQSGAQGTAMDVLIRTFPKTYEMTFDELARAVDRLVTRIA